MATHIVVVAGNTGYRHQLDRARRFLERMEEPRANEVEFQDMVWAFFQNCWHVKDWMEYDPVVPRQKKDIVIELAHRSVVLRVCQEMCNGTKHLGARPRAKHQHIELMVDSVGNTEMDCIIDNGQGTEVSGRMLSHQCIAEWVSILQSQGLATARLS